MIGGKYQILSKIGEGKFGQVFLGQKAQVGKRYTVEEQVAIKIEIKNAAYDLKLLKQETTILNYLYSRGCRHIPFVYWFGIYENSPTLVMTYYDGGFVRLPINNIYQGVNTMVDILENIHAHFVIHRDIKPQNFMMKGQDLYLIDFGLATIYVDTNKKHVLAKNDKTTILGTPKFVSPNVHNGQDPSRRDDLISVGYIYLYLLCGEELPWQNIQLTAGSNNYENCDQINGQNAKYYENHILHPKNVERKRLKSWTSIMEFLDYNTTISNEDKNHFKKYMDHLYGLKYDEKPNYEVIRFPELMIK